MAHTFTDDDLMAAYRERCVAAGLDPVGPSAVTIPLVIDAVRRVVGAVAGLGDLTALRLTAEVLHVVGDFLGAAADDDAEARER